MHNTDTSTEVPSAVQANIIFKMAYALFSALLMRDEDFAKKLAYTVELQVQDQLASKLREIDEHIKLSVTEEVENAVETSVDVALERFEEDIVEEVLSQVTSRIKISVK